uniref:Uncharacterized protein n=1 Tax=Anguilla anguilla TaxID=7936 RepID=A0A0E9SKR5_ANGAN
MKKMRREEESWCLEASVCFSFSLHSLPEPR